MMLVLGGGGLTKHSRGPFDHRGGLSMAQIVLLISQRFLSSLHLTYFGGVVLVCVCVCWVTQAGTAPPPSPRYAFKSEKVY